MSFQELVKTATSYFPQLKIKYKNQSLLMKILSKILFFNREFMVDSITTVGNSIYFPNPHFVALHPITSSVALMHELVHFKHTRRQAHLSALYCVYLLGKKLHFDPKLDKISKQFNYCGMFYRLDKSFDESLIKIKLNERPFEDPIFDVLDDLVTKV